VTTAHQRNGEREAAETTGWRAPQSMHNARRRAEDYHATQSDRQSIQTAASEAKAKEQ